jgi:hypothetical protein
MSAHLISTYQLILSRSVIFLRSFNSFNIDRILRCSALYFYPIILIPFFGFLLCFKKTNNSRHLKHHHSMPIHHVKTEPEALFDRFYRLYLGNARCVSGFIPTVPKKKQLTVLFHCWFNWATTCLKQRHIAFA